MYARVARGEGGEAEAIRSATAEVRSSVESGPPEGLRSTGFTLLADPDRGSVLALSLFDTEADLREGDRVLNEMSPPGGGFGQRQAVEMYEVVVDVRMGERAATT
jgi:hypothetical protein